MTAPTHPFIENPEIRPKCGQEVIDQAIIGSIGAISGSSRPAPSLTALRLHHRPAK
jgi:hypothetical protein